MQGCTSSKEIVEELANHLKSIITNHLKSLTGGMNDQLVSISLTRPEAQLETGARGALYTKADQLSCGCKQLTGRLAGACRLAETVWEHKIAASTSFSTPPRVAFAIPPFGSCTLLATPSNPLLPISQQHPCLSPFTPSMLLCLHPCTRYPPARSPPPGVAHRPVMPPACAAPQLTSR